jgi:uncharacterized integral membrane protein (TIGR00698 family)
MAQPQSGTSPMQRPGIDLARHGGTLARYVPGLALAALVAWVSDWASGFLGQTVLGFARSPISAVTVAILLGLFMSNVIALPRWLAPGLSLSVKKVLRLGIILLGLRLSLFDVFRLGMTGVPIVLVCILAALYLTTRLNRWLKLPDRLGTLIGVGTSICGVSAIVATGPAIEAREEEIAYAVAVITVFGIVATLVYPYLAYAIFAGDAVRSGYFLGTAIHDTSQVTGAGMVFADLGLAPQALDVATVTKLVRNVFMAAVIPWMAIQQARRTAQVPGETTSFGQLFPLFVIGFLLMAAVRTIGDAGVMGSALFGGRALGLWDAAGWQAVHATVTSWASLLLTVALAAVGLSTRFSAFRGLGIKPFLVGLGAATSVGLVSVITILLLAAAGAC